MARGNSLFRNLPDRFARVSGLEPPALLVERGGWGWGGQFIDVDNDGDLDIHSLSGYYTAPALPGTHPDL
jgi:CubicO group peptidase (beta-lactamase class C family)